MARMRSSFAASRGRVGVGADVEAMAEAASDELRKEGDRRRLV